MKQNDKEILIQEGVQKALDWLGDNDIIEVSKKYSYFDEIIKN